MRLLKSFVCGSDELLKEVFVRFKRLIDVINRVVSY